MTPDFEQLERIANNIRIDIIKMLTASGSGHPGGSLSAVEIITALYFHVMNLDPENLADPNRDRFVLSKGHGAPVLYAALAEKGIIGKEELLTLRKLGSRLQGHPDMKKIPGIEMSTGSLGQGFSTAVGMALAAKLDQRQSNVYTLLGDGELQEGLVWEAAMCAAHYHLDHLIAFVDWNGLQIDGNNDDVMTVRPVDEKFKAFGWNVIAIDGNKLQEVIKAVEQARQLKGKPTLILAHTVKGKGVSFMEGNAGWHGKAPSEEEGRRAVAELGGQW